MKKFVKILCIILALAMVVPMGLISCGSDTDKKEEGGKKEEEAKELVIFADGKSDYTIVRPDSSPTVLTDAVTSFRAAFKDKFGAEPDISSDWVKKGEEVPVGTKEILVGNTNRPETAEVKKALEKDTFIIKAVGNRLVFVADSDSLLVSALAYFVENYVEKSDGTVKVPTDFVYVGTLEDYAPFKDNGDGTVTVMLKNFIITYDSSSIYSFIPSVAKVFGELAEEKTGLVGVSEDATVNEYEILFGACEREQFTVMDKPYLFRDYSIVFKDGKLCVNAISIYGFQRAMEYMLEGFGDEGITIPTAGYFSEYDYGIGAYADLYKNYENGYLDGAWIFNMCHRGDVTGGLPENSIPAYQSCIDNKVDIIETDLKCTKDGIWVVCHDKKLDRTTNGSGTIANMTWSQIQKVKLKSKNGGSGAKVTDERMPTLENIIDLCHGKTLFNLDHLGPEMFQSVYDVFEKKGAVDMAQFKTSEWSAADLTNWFCKLMKEGRELPLFSPLLYSNTVEGMRAFRGLTSLTETGKGHNAGTAGIAKDCNIRLLCMTALSPELDGPDTWKGYREVGYLGIMTDEPIKLKNFIHGS